MAHDYEATGEETWLSIDPGLTTGYATFKSNGDLIRTGTVVVKENADLYKWLNCLPYVLDGIIMEDYTLFPWKAMGQSWDKLHTVRFIGAIQYWASQYGTPVIFQPPSVKPIGYKWAGMTKPKNHAYSHEPDAFVHGVYYLQNAGIRRIQHGRAK